MLALMGSDGPSLYPRLPDMRGCRYGDAACDPSAQRRQSRSRRRDRRDRQKPPWPLCWCTVVDSMIWTKPAASRRASLPRPAPAAPPSRGGGCGSRPATRLGFVPTRLTGPGRYLRASTAIRTGQTFTDPVLIGTEFAGYKARPCYWFSSRFAAAQTCSCDLTTMRLQSGLNASEKNGHSDHAITSQNNHTGIGRNARSLWRGFGPERDKLADTLNH